ncbi:phage portal protein [Escherichia coli]|uniref:phage portal protein n=1 Tax=Escherichia coli TaxID=562 RepID=UPI000FF776AC|nr:phage portal protein [Escherichia coli]ROJ58274.1 phage portal protein [Escherichia coli]
MWNLLRRTRKNQKSGRDVREAGWTSLFQAVAEPFSGAWQQGVKADPEAVLSFHAVFACISLISQDIAKMRLRLMQTDAHGIRRETRRGDIARLCRRPNAQQNRIQFFELWLNAKLRHGNTVVLKIRNARGQIKELRILDWSRVEPLVADDGEVFYRITPDRNCGITEAVTVPAREVIHDRFNCFFHPLIGLPPVYAAGLAATQGHHIQENSTSFFRNGGRPSGVIEIPGSITEENAKKLKSNWDSGYTGENAGKTAILSNGAKYNPTTFSPVDAQTVEQLKMTAEIVCSVFRVPAYKIGVGQPPSSDNVEALEQQYYSQCLQTLIESIELLLDEALETGENESTEFDVTTLLRMDSERRMKTLGDAVKNTLLTPNEARKRENLPPLAGGDALYLQQQNYSLEALSRRDAREDPFASAGKTVSSQLPDGASDGNKAISETEHDAVKAMFRGDTEKMTERELSIIRALGEEFSTVLADLQRTFEGKMASQAQAFEEKLTSLSAVLQKHVTVDEVRPVLQAMVDDAVGAIPVPRDGRDYDPDVLQQAVNDAVANIPQPADGKSLTPDDVRPMLEQMVKEAVANIAVANIPQPADGKSLTPDDVRPMLEQMVKEAVSHIPVPRDGRDYDPEVLQKAVNDAVANIPQPADGKSLTPDDVRPMLEQMVKEAVSHIPVPRDGRDYDPDVLQKAVNDAVANIPQPADGKSLTPDDVRPMLEQMVKEAVSHIHVPRDGRDYDPDVLQKAVLDAVSALPAPQDGRDATALEILPAIDDQKSFPRGTYATHQGGLWRAYEKTHGMRGWECLVDGVADIDVSMTGERLFSVVVRQSSGQRTEKTFSLPVMLYRGVFRAGETYHPGDTVTWGGSLWHCNSMTEDKPGEAHSSAWTLAAKRGRDAGGGK